MVTLRPRAPQLELPGISSVDFPVEILLLIIPYIVKSKDLYAFSLVNKTWHSIAYQRLWGYIEVSTVKSASHLRAILQRTSDKKTRLRSKLFGAFSRTIEYPRNITSLVHGVYTADFGNLHDTRWHFSFLTNPINSLLLSLSSLPNLKKLVLPQSRVFKPMAVFSGLQSLQELDLSKSLGGPDGYLDRLLLAIAKNCPKLLKIKFGMSLCMDPSLVHASSLTAIGESCSLTDLTIHLADPKVHMHSSNLSLLFRACKNLKRVDLQNLCCSEYRTVIRTLIIHNRQISHLNVSLSSAVESYSDLILSTLTKYAPQFEEFRFGPKPLFSDDGLTLLMEECPKLRILDIHGSPSMTHRSLTNFGKWAMQLEELNVSDCPALTFQALKGLVGCPRLRIIDGRRIQSSFCVPREEVLRLLFQGIPTLESVRFTQENGQDAIRYRWQQQDMIHF